MNEVLITAVLTILYSPMVVIAFCKPTPESYIRNKEKFNASEEIF